MPHLPMPIKSRRNPRLILAFCLALLVAVMACAAPGEGRKAAAGYALCEPLIDGLARYHGEYASYPDTLDALVPGFVDTIPVTYDNFPILYARTDASYTLEFSYQRPGMNTCVYTPDSDWSCSGYF
jgi:hypothetical protein